MFLAVMFIQTMLQGTQMTSRVMWPVYIGVVGKEIFNIQPGIRKSHDYLSGETAGVQANPACGCQSCCGVILFSSHNQMGALAFPGDGRILQMFLSCAVLLSRSFGMRDVNMTLMWPSHSSAVLPSSWLPTSCLLSQKITPAPLDRSDAAAGWREGFVSSSLLLLS